MGNGQSAEAPQRAPNKLSKPRTNTATGNAKAPTRQNSQQNGSSRHSIVPSDVVVDEKRRKRMSLFRSKSEQPKSALDSTDDLTQKRWSRNNSITQDSNLERFVERSNIILN
jgi:hypothetical protein